MVSQQSIWSVMVLGLLLSILTGCSDKDGWADLWLTPGQQAEQLMRDGDYQAAAQKAIDPLRRANALYRSKDFEGSLLVYATIDSAEGHFNRGNALVLLGNYEEAIDAYRTALAIRPGWTLAEDNLQIALLRAERLKAEGGEMTDGQLEADEIVFEEGGADQSKQTIDMSGGKPLNDEQIRALWLRNVQTRPADFLRVKFAYQYARQTKGESP